MTPSAVECESFRIRTTAELRIAVVGVQQLPLLRESADTDRSIIATILSELGTNMLKYADGGLLRVCRRETPDAVDIELWAEDAGPGIPDPDLALSDHYSTGGTLGLGLPGVRRMSDEFWIRSTAETGTVVFARKRIRSHRGTRRPEPPGSPAADSAPVPNARRGHRPYDLGTCVRPCGGYGVSGDAVATLEIGDHLFLALIDGTGHGRSAHDIAARVADTVERHAGESDLVRLMDRLHAELQGTAGAAVGLADVDLVTQTFRYLGVGNIRASKLGRRPWRGLSRDGVLGARLPKPYLQQERLDTGDLLMLWTDGMPELDCVAQAAAISYRSAAEIAAKLVATLGKPHDDVGCLMLKWQP